MPVSSSVKSYIKRMTVRVVSIRREYLRIIRVVSGALDTLTALAALVCLICLVAHVGYDHTPSGYARINSILRAIQWFYVAAVIYGFTFDISDTLRKARVLKWVVDTAVLLAVVPLVYTSVTGLSLLGPQYSHALSVFSYSSLAAYSIVSVSYEFLRAIDRRTNPSLVLSMSFVVLIFIGTALLMMPKATVDGIDFIDALFVSTSAVCVTGLTPVDVASTFTPLGLVVLSILIELGALGVMTFTSFFALFFSGNASVYTQLLLKDVVYSKSFNELLPTLIYILGFTLTVELFGAALIFASVHGSMDMDLKDELVFSAFTSLSAFCNAGFSNLPDGMSNAILLGRNTSIYWILSALIVAGSLGFPILMNFRDYILMYIRRKWRMFHKLPPGPRTIHPFNMNTRVVFCTYIILLAAGAVVFFVLEYSHSLRGFGFWDKVTQSVFNSAIPRSAGFSSVNPVGFFNSTLLLVMFLMWVGGGAQSTGGGIKVNTFAAVWLNLRAIITGKHKVTAFNRTISVGSLRRANAVVALSIISYFGLSFLLLGLEPGLPPKDILFEACSALFTVGSSLGVTANLGVYSKLLLCVAMFAGRVGIISLLTGIGHKRSPKTVTYPSDNLIIN